jgi:hypothetical protein
LELLKPKGHNGTEVNSARFAPQNWDDDFFVDAGAIEGYGDYTFFTGLLSQSNFHPMMDSRKRMWLPPARWGEAQPERSLALPRRR